MSKFFRGLYGYVRGLDWRKWQGLKVSVMTWFRLVEVEGLATFSASLGSVKVTSLRGLAA